MRYLDERLWTDLKSTPHKMLFLSGPRQTGKTTLVQKLLENQSCLYLNWDDPDQRKRIVRRDWSDEDEILVLDEIHKYKRWKNFLKGTFDTQKNIHRFVVTGSARLDTFKKGQDSMVGRFWSWRLHPFCLAELTHTLGRGGADDLRRLLERGGFPEPFLNKQVTFAKRWRNERKKLVFRQDIQELENIRDISLLEFFHDALASRVGGGVVLSNISKDLEIAPKTAKAWLNLLEKTYSVFLVTPYSGKLAKTILKTPKVYFYDNGEVDGDEGARFENMVANHLWKRIQYLEDSTGDRFELQYIRDKMGHEVDFLILKNRKPLTLIEVKLSDTVPSKSLYYFRDRIKPVRVVQVVLNHQGTQTRDGISVTAAETWLARPLDEEP